MIGNYTDVGNKVYLILHLFNCFYQFFPLHLQVHNGTEESIISDEIRFNGSVVSGYLGVMTLTHDPQGACPFTEHVNWASRVPRAVSKSFIRFLSCVTMA